MEPIYPLTICKERFNVISEGQAGSIPCCWSHPIDTPNKYIKQAVIIIHGVLRNADEYYPNMMAAVSHAGVEETTLIVAPQFLLEEDLTRFRLNEDILFWGGETGEGWKKGDDSITSKDHHRKVSVSAFDVVDQIVGTISDLDTFPNFKRIVVSGHSAGGQYVNRYAAGTRIGSTLPEDIQLRFIVANPSTYLYFNGERRVGDMNHEFATPENPDQGYDDYKYGLLNLNRYMATTGIEEIRKSYPDKDVVYLLGGEDTREAHLEQTPNAILQGVNRLERGQVYYHYLKHFFGTEITQTQKIAVIPCVGHDNAAIFKSEAGIRYLFKV
jgi:hypothetical protein